MLPADFIRQYAPGTEHPALDRPSFRQAIYRELHTRVDASHGPLLREAMKHEIAYRAEDGRPIEPCAPGDIDYFENMYWCGLLLSRIGDVRDVPLLWRAKNVNFDTGAGFDIQFLVGAGVQETLDFLAAQKDKTLRNAADRISVCRKSGDFDDMVDWLSFRMGYFA